MKWSLLDYESSDEVRTTTSAMKVGAKTVMVRVQSITHGGDIAETITVVPNCRLISGGCGEKATLAPYTGTSR